MPDRRAAERQLLQGGDGVAGAQPRVLHLLGVAAEFLPEPHGRRVHEMGAADLDHLPKLHRLAFQRAVETLPARA